MIALPESPANPQTLFRAVAAVADALYVIDVSGRITFLNPAAVNILGYASEEELLGCLSHDTIHYQHPDGSPFPAETCPLLRPRLTGETVHNDHDWFFRKDGAPVPVSYSSAPVELADGRGAVLAFRDISDRLRLGEVEASRARIARAADDARKTIERDLHDGAQQQFVAVSMRLETARRLIRTAPAQAASLVETAYADLREAIAELQRLAHGIHPAELTERGLQPALRALARRCAMPVELEAADTGRLLPEIETTAYYIAAEAVTNAVKHSGADHVAVAVARSRDGIHLTITDYGGGGAAFDRGTGLQGIRDRAEAVGGKLSLASPPVARPY